MSLQPVPVILVVNGDAEARNTVSGQLRRAGFTVVIVANGFQALATLAARSVSLVLCARELPGLSGASVLAEVRRREVADQRAPTPFVWLPEPAAAELAAPSDHLAEPIDAQQMAHRMRAEMAGAPPAAASV